MNILKEYLNDGCIYFIEHMWMSLDASESSCPVNFTLIAQTEQTRRLDQAWSQSYLSF